MAFVPSTYQQAVFSWLGTSEPTLAIKALAGSGKTSTLVECAKRLPANGSRGPLRARFVAFNTSIQTELASRLKGTPMEASTIHSLGYSAIRFAARKKDIASVDTDTSKYSAVVKAWKDEHKRKAGITPAPGAAFRAFTSAEIRALEKADAWGDWVGAVLRLFNLGRLALVRFDQLPALAWLCRAHTIEVAPELEQLTSDVLAALAAWGRSSLAKIDFTDMVWIPVVCKMWPRSFDWVFIDECQDLSPAALELILMARQRGTGRMIFVGDPNQSIYAFAGADSKSFERIVQRTEARVLPLSICYRCPTTVLDAARTLCPEIEARPDAPEGVVRTVERAGLCLEVDDGDMILCRRTAPLLSACFELIANGQGAVVRGRDIAEGLIELMKKIAKGSTFAGFAEALKQWAAERAEWAHKRFGDDEDRVREACELAMDQAECLRLVWARQTRAGTFDAVEQELRRMFDDSRRAPVELSTIHRAKGLEKPRVFILDAERLPRERGGRGGQARQEENLAYVAITRAAEELVFVVGGKKAA